MANARRSSRLKEGPAKNMAEPDGSDSWESSGEDEEEDEAPARRGKSPRRGQTADAGGARKRQRKAPANLSGLSLWDIVQQHANAIPNAAKEWVERYREGRAEATAELLSVLVKASGCNVDLTAEEVEDGGVDELVAELAQQVKQDGERDPFNGRGVPRTLKHHYVQLWDYAMREAANADCLFDDYLLDKATHLVTALSCSVVRPFRFAATLTASQLVSTYIKVQGALTSARETAQFQLEAEQKKRGKEGAKGGGALKGGAADRIATLKRNVDKSHRRVQELKTYTTNIFQGVFAHRFRDVSESIRATVIEGIGAWIAASPSQFLNDGHLKYLAWALSDRHEAVRAAAVKAVARLYDSSDNIGPLHDFTERFTPRFVELPFDVDDGVSAAGMSLLCKLMDVGELGADKVNDVYCLLNDGSPIIRRAAASLVSGLLEARGRSVVPAQAPAETVQQAGKAARAKKAAAKGKAAAQSPGGSRPAAAAAALSKADVQLLGLLDLMEQLAKGQPDDPSTAANRRTSLALTAAAHSGLSSSSQGALQQLPLPRASVALLVDALWEAPPLEGLLSDWGLMVKALGDEAAAEDRGDLGNVHLAALLAAAVQRASSLDILSHKAPGRAKPGANAAAAADSERQRATLALMGPLPQLLGRHQADAFVVAPLLTIVPELKLELFALKAGGSAKGSGLATLLSLVEDAFFRHGDEELQRSAARALLHCAKTGPSSVQEAAALALRDTVVSAANKLVAAAKAVQKMRYAALQDAVCDLAVAPDNAPAAIVGLLLALRRVHVLMSEGAAELATHEAVQSACQALLLQHVEGRELGPSLMDALLHLMQTVLLWRHHAALVSGEDDEVDAYVEARTEFLERVTTLASDSGEDADTAAVRRITSAVLTDTMLVAGVVGTAGGEALSERVRLVPGRDALEAAWGALCAVLAAPLPDGAGGAAADDWDDDDDAEAGEGAADHEERAATARHAMRARAQAVASLGRLVAFDALEGVDFLWVAARVVSVFAGHGKEVSDAVREVIRAMKRTHAPQLPAIYLGAMEQAWAPVEADADDDAAQQRFGAVADRIASTYAGFNLSAPPILAIVRGGIAFALHNPPSRLNYLPWGLSHFTTKLPPADAGKVAEELEQKIAKLQGRPEDGGDGWDGLDTYLQGLKDRAACHKVTKGVLKTPGSARAKPPAATAAAAGAGAAAKGRRKTGRSISFAPAAARKGRGRGRAESDEEEEEEEEREEIEEADDEADDDGAGDDGHVEQEEQEGQEEEEEEEAPRAKKGRGTASMPPPAPKTRTPAERKARMRAVDVDAGPLATPSQTQSQSQSLKASGGRSQSQRSASQPSGSQRSQPRRGSGGGRGGSLRHTASEGSDGLQHDDAHDDDLLAGPEGSDDNDDDSDDDEQNGVELMPTEEEVPRKRRRQGGRAAGAKSGRGGSSSGSPGASLGDLMAPADEQEEEEEEELQLDTVTQDTTIDVDMPPPKPKRRRRNV